MGVHGHLAVDERIDRLRHLTEVLGVQLLKLLHEGLRSHGLLILLLFWLLLLWGLLVASVVGLLLMLLLLLLLTGDGLLTPGGLSHGLLLGDATGTARRLHKERGTRLGHGLGQSVLGAPLLDRTGLELHRLFVDVGKLHELRLLHLHVKVDARRSHRVVRRQDHLQRVSRGSLSLEDQVIRWLLSWEICDTLSKFSWAVRTGKVWLLTDALSHWLELGKLLHELLALHQDILAATNETLDLDRSG